VNSEEGCGPVLGRWFYPNVTFPFHAINHALHDRVQNRQPTPSAGSAQGLSASVSISGVDFASSAGHGPGKSKCWELGATRKSGFIGSQPATSLRAPELHQAR